MTMPSIIDDRNLPVVDPSKLVDDRPFSNPIELTKVQVAGLYYIEDTEPLSELKIGGDLKLIREPDNIFDRNAIRIRDGSDRDIGYVPKSRNQIISNIMDGGKHVYCKVSSINESYEDITIVVSVIMDDF